MSILNNIRRYFGIDAGDESEYTPSGIYGDDTDDPAKPVPTRHDKIAPDIEPPMVSDSMKEKILDGVLEVFNEALPEFIRGSIDAAAQRRELMERLDNSIREYLDSLAGEARSYAESRLIAQAENAKGQSEEYQRKMQVLESEKNKIREQQLSSDRQRRALSERVRDLEAQLSKTEAESEQYQLENQSLLNKLKLADIQPGIVEDLRKEIEQLRKEKDETNPEASAQSNARIEELTALLQAETERHNADSEKLADALARIADFESSADMAKTMVADAELKLSEQREDFTARLQASREECNNLETQLREAQTIIDSVYEMKEQMAQVGEIIKKRDEKIARLKSTNRKMKSDLEQLRQQYEQSKADNGGLFALPETEPVAVADDLEDDFQCPEWFVSEPEPGMGNIKSEPSEFGYTEPPRKPSPPENKAQLTLF